MRAPTASGIAIMCLLVFALALLAAGCGGGGGAGGTASSGTVSGVIRDAADARGIAAAAITIGTSHGASGSDGAYRISGIPVGVQPVAISATGYLTHSDTLQVAAGENLRDFDLTPQPPGPTPAITVTRPDGGESWLAGATEDAQWQSQGAIDHVRLEYSPNAATTWRTIATGAANTGSYAWDLPQAITAQALLRATAEDAASLPLAQDASDGAFTISPPPGKYAYLRSDEEGGAGGAVSVPIYVTDAAGIAGADITLTFDPALLTATGATVTPLTSGFSIVWNATPGQIRIGLASAAGIAGGAGALVDVQFTVGAAAGSTTPLTLQAAALYDSSAQPIVFSQIDGLFTVR